MADYFTNFSLLLALPNEDARKYALDLAHQAGTVMQGNDMPDSFPAALREVVEDWQFETDPSDQCDLWLHTPYGGVDAVCAFIQHLLQRFNPGGRVTFEWSNDCSKPRVDAYGGGAALITARRIKHLNTGEWLHRQTARRAAQKPAPEIPPAQPTKGTQP